MSETPTPIGNIRPIGPGSPVPEQPVRRGGEPLQAPSATIVDYRGGTHFMDPPGRVPEWSFANDCLRATIKHVPEEGPHHWRLMVEARVALKEVRFPRDQSAIERGDIIYYPRLGGMAVRATTVLSGFYRPYPGGCFAPIVVRANERRARLAAAANWPPVKVSPYYNRGGMGMCYDGQERMGPGETRIFEAICGEFPTWQAAVDVYRTWLRARLDAAGLKTNYPRWLREAEGWWNLQLENYWDEQIGGIPEEFERYRPWLPWVQMWGQMSDRHMPGGPETGCCLPRIEFHERYLTMLRSLAELVRHARGRMGYYMRPRPPYKPLVGPDADHESEAWLQRWRFEHRKHYANGVYMDVFGFHDFGPLLEVATWLRDRMPADVVIEGLLDVYPVAHLMSGCLWAGFQPPLPPAMLPGEFDEVSFPRFGRYLLNDRVVFMGESNGDHMYWGTTRLHDYWTERQAFLLGAKFDAMRVMDTHEPGRVNRAMVNAIEERWRVGWWARRPVYMDTVGIEGAAEAEAAGVRVRKFVDENGVTLVAVDNWAGAQGVRFVVDGKEFEVSGRGCLTFSEIK